MIALHSSTREPGVASGAELASEGSHPVSEITLIDICICLARHKWLISKMTALALLVGAILCFVLPVRYTAATQIMPPRQTQSELSLFMNQLASSGAGSLSVLAGGGLGLRNPEEIYIGLLQSRPIADAIIEKFGLANVYHARDMTGARKKLADNTAVVLERSGLITVSVTDRDRQRAAAMANAYAEQLRVLTKTLAVTEAAQRRLFYEEQLKPAKDGLVAAEFSFQQVQQQKGLVQPDAQARALIASLGELHGLAAAKEVELQALRSYSTENNPSVQLAENQLSSLQAEIAQLEQRNRTSGSSNLGIEDVPGASIDYLRAEHELQYRQTLFDLLLREYDAARLDEAKEGTVIQVVGPAIVPDRHSSPKRAQILLASAFIGIFAGCCLALLLGWKAHLQSDPYAVNKFRTLQDALAWRATAR